MKNRIIFLLFTAACLMAAACEPNEITANVPHTGGGGGDTLNVNPPAIDYTIEYAVSDTAFDFHGSAIEIALTGQTASDCLVRCEEEWVSVEKDGGKFILTAQGIKDKGTRDATAVLYNAKDEKIEEFTFPQNRGDKWDYLDNFTDAEAIKYIIDKYTTEAERERIYTSEEDFQNKLNQNLITGFNYKSATGRLVWYDFTNFIPEEIGTFKNLTQIYIVGDPKVEWTMPESIVKCKSLGSLIASNQNLCGTLPEGMKDLPLKYFMVGKNNLEGPIPEWFANVDEGLVILENRFSGKVPDVVVQSTIWQKTREYNLQQQEGYVLYE